MSSSEGEPKSKRPKPSSSIVELNVGGTHFDTTRSTLLARGASPYFTRLLAETEQGEYTITGAFRDRKGRIFIDRQPQLFSQILEYLRFNLEEHQLSERERSSLRKEALYYQLDELVELLREHSKGYDE